MLEATPPTVIIASSTISTGDFKSQLANAAYSVLLTPHNALPVESENGASPDLVLIELGESIDGNIEKLAKVKSDQPSAAIIALAKHMTPDTELQYIKAGAYDCLALPTSPEYLLVVLAKWREREYQQSASLNSNSGLPSRANFSNLIANSDVMKEIFEMIKRLANFNTTVLVTGESGTGKELLAKAIHQNSPRRGHPFVAINCGAIPENLMESELFGHKKGAFTDATKDKKGLFEEANGGTIFLDEIGELPLHLQVKLLRALQEQQIRRVGDELTIDIDIRVIAATLRNLDEDVDTGRFREDLFYRLNVISIHIPPLRERRDDIPVLIEHFIKKHNKRLGLSIKSLEPEVLKTLMSYSWKGNVRELENCIERALVLTESDQITMDALPEAMHSAKVIQESMSDSQLVGDDNLSIKQRSRALEISLILKALKKTSGNRTKAAKVLEISHRALLYKLKEYGLS